MVDMDVVKVAMYLVESMEKDMEEEVVMDMLAEVVMV